MARGDSGGAITTVLLLAGGYAIYRWWTGREAPADEGDQVPAGITTELQALIDSMKRTAAGGPQPGDTTSVATADDEKPPPAATLRDKLLDASKGDSYFTADQKANVHRWNWYLRQVTGVSEAETPDLAGVGDPADILSVDGYLARRTAAGMSGLGFGQFRHVRRARYPVWLPRPGGRAACGCAATGCNCYRV